MLINEITEKTGLTKKAIRFYEDKGLIEVSREENGYRTYTEETLEALKKIKLLRMAGISLSDIKLLLSGVVRLDELISKREAEIKKEGGNIAAGLEMLRAITSGDNLGDSGELDESFAEVSEVGEVIVGVDIGTTTISAVVIDLKNRRVAESYTIMYGAELECAEPEFKERDTESIISRATALTDHIIKSYGSIRSIGVTGQMHGIVYLDKDGNPISPLRTWQDKRADKTFKDGKTYCEVMNEVLSERVATGYGLATHFYNLKNQLVPSEAHTVATIMDLFVMKLTGRTAPLMHTSNAASLGGFNTRELRFDTERLSSLGICDLTLPDVTAGYTSAGEYKGIPVSVAIGDNQASFIGSVKDTERSVLVNFGTGGQISAVTKECTKDDILESRPLLNDSYLLCASSLSCGAAYSMLEKFFRALVIESGGKDASCYEMMNSMAERAFREKKAPLTVNTCFAGQRHNRTAKGSVVDITPESFTPEALTLGFVFGMCRELYDMFDGKCDGKEYLVASGNAAQKIPVVKDILKELFRLPVYISDGKEEASRGAALYAALTFGILSENEAKEFIRYKE